jgi:hypothetical protein
MAGSLLRYLYEYGGVGRGGENTLSFRAGIDADL